MTKITHLNPEGLPSMSHFSIVVTADTGKTIYVSGLVALDEQMQLVGEGDLKAQIEQTYENIRISLNAAGATPANIVRQRVYVVGLKPEHIALLAEAMGNFYGRPGPSSTAVGVTGLIIPGALVEVDVTAII